MGACVWCYTCKTAWHRIMLLICFLLRLTDFQWMHLSRWWFTPQISSIRQPLCTLRGIRHVSASNGSAMPASQRNTLKLVNLKISYFWGDKPKLKTGNEKQLCHKCTIVVPIVNNAISNISFYSSEDSLFALFMVKVVRVIILIGEWGWVVWLKNNV